MAICPILILADVASKADYLWNVIDPEKKFHYIVCLESRCQMWDSIRADCGLKHPTPQPVVKPGIDQKHYFKGEPPPSEPE